MNDKISYAFRTPNRYTIPLFIKVSTRGTPFNEDIYTLYIMLHYAATALYVYYKHTRVCLRHFLTVRILKRYSL